MATPQLKRGEKEAKLTGDGSRGKSRAQQALPFILTMRDCIPHMNTNHTQPLI
uniref:Uncharacterized protein n=1 Tax=Arundo donax TaxID=35708 RepID=A0A0A9ADK4_ARUDO